MKCLMTLFLFRRSLFCLLLSFFSPEPGFSRQFELTEFSSNLCFFLPSYIFMNLLIYLSSILSTILHVHNFIYFIFIFSNSSLQLLVFAMSMIRASNQTKDSLVLVTVCFSSILFRTRCKHTLLLFFSFYISVTYLFIVFFLTCCCWVQGLIGGLCVCFTS